MWMFCTTVTGALRMASAKLSVMSSPSFTPEQLKRSKTYTRFFLGLLELQAFIVMGGAYYFGNSGLSRRTALWAYSVTGNYYLALTLFASLFFGAMATFLYFAIMAKHMLDRRFGISKVSLKTWLQAVNRTIWLRFLAGLIGAEFVFVSARFIGFSWWIPAAVLAALYVYLLFALYLPAMHAAFGPEVRFPDGPLRTRLEALCQRSGVPIREIYEWQVGERSTMGNAMVTGLGKNRRILISDTLCRLCSDDEVEAILAHEIGHEANKDVRSRALYRLVTQILICFVLCEGSQLFYHAVPWDFATLPGLWLGYTILSVYAQFGLAFRSRQQERAADLYAWKLMGSSSAFISGLRKLTEANLIHVKKGSKRFGHPSLEERIIEADRFEASLRTTNAPPPPPPLPAIPAR
jgi:STE24 endopeptidase